MATSWLNRLLKKSRPLSRSGRKKLWRNPFLPNVEALGDRIVPSAFHVTTLADGGAGSLRAAIAQANAHAGADTVDFQPGLTGTVALTGGQLDVTDDLAIDGPGADLLTVGGNHTSRVFKVEAGKAVRISGLTMAGGNAGILNGGGIDNFGALTVSNVVSAGNAAINGGGLANHNGATVTVRDSVFTSNSVAADGGHGDGGGLANENGGTATVTGSTFTGNSANRFGGGLFNFAVTFINEAAGDPGGQVRGPVGTVTVRDSTFTGNSAESGGGLDNSGRLTVGDSTFAGNSARGAGGGLDNDLGGTVTVSDSAFTRN